MKSDLSKILEFLQAHRFMSIATYDTEIWIANVYYVVDDAFNVSLLSDPKTEHGKAIQINSSVACSIADSFQSVTDKKVGVQIRGSASRVYGPSTMKWMLTLWNSINPGYEKIMTIQNIQKKIIHSRIYKVQTKRIKFFNDALYGKKEWKEFSLE
jgi:uncharacterized protein YhbP (UPF0306 family)